MDGEDDGVAFAAPLLLHSPHVCEAGVQDKVAAQREGVSPGQQEPCLFSSALLDFQSVPAELTASSRFAWGDW